MPSPRRSHKPNNLRIVAPFTMPLMHKRGFLAVLLLLTSFAIAQDAPPPVEKITDPKPSILLISFDGFRWDYLHHAKTPNLHRLMKEGVAAEALIPSFPTKTFPNHYTIVTGLYPAHHGIVANNIWDPRLNKKFSMDDRTEVRD